MEREEFEADWSRMLAKLTPSEQEMVSTVIAGAEVNYSLVYILLAFVLGGVAGFLL